MSAPPPAASSEATPNLLHVQFKNPEFLSYLSHLQSTGQVAPIPGLDAKTFDPNHPLTEHNVMAYFATSPFFDRRSNNEQIRMQNIANGIHNLTGGMGASHEEQELKRFTGLEFVLVHARPPLCFVIQKRWRTSPTESRYLNPKSIKTREEKEKAQNSPHRFPPSVVVATNSNALGSILHCQRLDLPSTRPLLDPCYPAGKLCAAYTFFLFCLPSVHVLISFSSIPWTLCPPVLCSNPPCTVSNPRCRPNVVPGPPLILAAATTADSSSPIHRQPRQPPSMATSSRNTHTATITRKNKSKGRRRRRKSTLNQSTMGCLPQQ